MGMDGLKNGKTGRVKFLKDFTGYYDSKWEKGSVHTLRYWPDEKEKNIIWWNEGQGNWNSSELGVDVEMEDPK